MKSWYECNVEQTIHSRKWTKKNFFSLNFWLNLFLAFLFLFEIFMLFVLCCVYTAIVKTLQINIKCPPHTHTHKKKKKSSCFFPLVFACFHMMKWCYIVSICVWCRLFAYFSLMIIQKASLRCFFVVRGRIVLNYFAPELYFYYRQCFVEQRIFHSLLLKLLHNLFYVYFVCVCEWRLFFFLHLKFVKGPILHSGILGRSRFFLL